MMEKTCPIEILTRLKFVIAALTMMVLLTPAFGQTTAEEWFDKGVALMNQNKYHEAIQAFDKAIEITPQYAEAWAGMGWALYGSSRYKEALQAYVKAHEVSCVH
jgi:tetratricopeptide (TPR) repeat protein